MNEPTMSPRSVVHDDDAREMRNTATDGGDASALARHKDPSLTGATAAGEAKTKVPGVEWVRPTELLASRSGRIAGRGIDFQAELARRARRVPGQTVRATRRGATSTAAKVSERARRLPPASAFGRGGDERFSWVSRSGIGLG
ncbi:hypothetical protein DEA06_15755 [Microbacterium sp. Gd 4-13]|uniref:hypothetical protein n=1 Tax=Microbacterium sp. Gd 4-13 TaxID=2173179 RepID=UPI000D5631EB|nr:hypothetical protein [Microbacterium sp. Gd 4-13]PVW02351.1 hypothetical protein DEA06_15755 [Microbacterium sp. Gd 4-13]